MTDAYSVSVSRPSPPPLPTINHRDGRKLYLSDDVRIRTYHLTFFTATPGLPELVTTCFEPHTRGLRPNDLAFFSHSFIVDGLLRRKIGNDSRAHMNLTSENQTEHN